MIDIRLVVLLVSGTGIFCAATRTAATPCADIGRLSVDGVETTKTAKIAAGTTLAPPFPGAPNIGPLPANCRVDGVIHKCKGADGEEFGIGFALALPEPAAWNGDFMLQGGGGNGIIAYPKGASYAGDESALNRLGCDFDPALLSCKAGKSDDCLAPEKVAAIKKAFSGPKNAYSTQVYPGFLYGTGIAEPGPVPGLLSLGNAGIFGP